MMSVVIYHWTRGSEEPDAVKLCIGVTRDVWPAFHLLLFFSVFSWFISLLLH